jgi:GT2 family glycosyltransferase
MSSTVNLTVVISTRNRPDALGRCLAGLLASRAHPAGTVIVDQSADGRTSDVVEAHRRSNFEILYVRHHGSGLGVSQNLGVSRASQPVIAVTDDDCVPDPDWLSVIDRTFQGPDDISLLTGRVLPLGPESPGLYPISLRTSSVGRDFTPDAMPWDIGSGNNFAVSRAWFTRIGGNDERLGPGSPGQGGVDMDLFYRLLRAGARVRYDPASLVFHEQTTRAGRMARRWPYGYGMGAACALRHAEGDAAVLRVLRQFVLLRLRRIATAARHGNWQRIDEEIRVLVGTWAGTLHGYRQHRADLARASASG